MNDRAIIPPIVGGVAASVTLAVTIVFLLQDYQYSYAGSAIGENRLRDLSQNPVYLMYNITTFDGHTIVQLSLHENNTGCDLVKFATFYLTVNETESNGRGSIFSDFFQTENGILVLDLIHRPPGNDSPMQIIGANQDPFLNAWVSDPDGRISINNFPFAADKNYLMHIEVIGIDNIRNILSDKETPSVDVLFGSSGVIDNNKTGNIATGNVLLVPEFGSSFILTISLVSMIAPVLAIQCFWQFRRKCQEAQK